MNEQLGIRSSLAEPGTRARHSRPATGHARLHALCSRLLNGAHRHAPCHTARSIGPDRDQSLLPVQPCPRCAPARPPRMRRGSRTHTRPARPRAPWAILLPHLTTPVCPESRRSRRELSENVQFCYAQISRTKFISGLPLTCSLLRKNQKSLK